MPKKLMTFLGTSKYSEVYHNICDKKIGPHIFIQESLVEFFCKDWNNEDKVIVVMTSGSKEKNWLSENGLEKKLDELKNKHCFKVKINALEIKEGKNEGELWEIFSEIFDNIDEEDEINLDITHSLRSLPILSLIVLNYAKVIKQIKIERILYAASEKLGSPQDIEKMPIENRIVPVFDLTPFVKLFDWTVAVDRFLKTGNASEIDELSSKEVKDVLRESKGEIGRGVRDLGKGLANYTEVIYTCRGPEIKESVKRIQENVKNINESETSLIVQLKYLIDKIDRRFSQFDVSSDVNSSLDAVEWCLENHLIQQGITILREAIVNYVIEKYVLKAQAEIKQLKQKENRECAEYMLREKEIEGNEIAELWHEIIDYRNDMNHAGWRFNNYHRSQNFGKS